MVSAVMKQVTLCSMLTPVFISSAINIVLFVLRAYYFKDFKALTGNAPNGFYMLSRSVYTASIPDASIQGCLLGIVLVDKKITITLQGPY